MKLKKGISFFFIIFAWSSLLAPLVTPGLVYGHNRNGHSKIESRYTGRLYRAFMYLTKCLQESAYDYGKPVVNFVYTIMHELRKKYGVPSYYQRPYQLGPIPKVRPNVKPVSDVGYEKSLKRASTSEGLCKTLMSYAHPMYLSGLTQKMKNKHIIHLQSNAYIPQQNHWSCGFHCLYNAGQLEKICGISNMSDGKFKKTCLKYGTPHIPSSTVELKRVADKLKLKNVIFLSKKEEKTRILFNKSLTVNLQWTGKNKPSIADWERAFAKKRAQNESQKWNSLRKIIHSSGSQVVHFICDAKADITVGHGILISALKNKAGEHALVIMDNINDKEPYATQQTIKKYAEEIYQKLFA